MPNFRTGSVDTTKRNDQKFSPVTKPARRTSRSEAAKNNSFVNLVDESDEADGLCHHCRKVFGESALCIQCDRCENWHHLGCTGLTKAQYTFLSKCPNKELIWFCDPCKTDDKDQLHPGAVIAQQAMKLEALTQIVMTSQQHMTTLQQQNNVIIETLTKSKAVDEQIGVHVNEFLNEQKELEEKKNNLLIFNLPETAEGTEDPETTDLAKTKEVLTFVAPEVDTSKLNTAKVLRIGKRRFGKDAGPRPIKITFDTDDAKPKFLANSKTLKDSSLFEKVCISADKTKQQQEQYRKLKERCERLRIETNEDYIIFRGECVVRSTIRDIINKTKIDSKNAATGGDDVSDNPDN